MKRLIIACVAMLFLAQPGFSLSFDALPNYQDEGMRLYVSGTGKLQEGRFAEAVNELRRAVRLRPDIAEAFHNLGFAFERTGDYQNAARAYERALRIKPDYASALNNLGYLLATTDTDVNKAVVLCQRAVELQPNSAHFHDSFGWALYKAGRHNEASRHFQAAIKLDQTFFKSHFNMGLLEYSQNNFANAIAHFKNTIQLNPAYHKAYLPLADSYEKMSDDGRALHAYRQALVRIPENDPVRRHIERKVKDLTEESRNHYFNNVKQMQGSSRLQEFMQRKNRSGSLMSAHSVAASPSVDSNSTFTPVSAVAGLPTASRSSATQNRSNALSRPVSSFARPVTQTVGNPLTRRQNDENTVALSYSSSSVQPRQQPRQLTVDQERELERRYSLSRSYIDRGLVQEAETELKRIISLAPEGSTVSRQSRNLLLRVRKQLEEKEMHRAVTHRDMGKDFFRSGQYAMAETEFAKALRLAPDNAEIHKDVALLHYNQGNYEQAYEFSKKAIALDRTLKEAYVVLGSLYAQKGRPDDALRALRMVGEVSQVHDSVDELAEQIIASLSSE